MSLVQDDAVAQAFAADTPDEPLDTQFLPWTPGGDPHIFDPHIPHPLPKQGAVDMILVSQEIPWCMIPWGCTDLSTGVTGAQKR